MSMACNCKHNQQEIKDGKAVIEELRKLFIKRMTVDSEHNDRRRKDYNQAIFHYEDDESVDEWNKYCDKYGLYIRCDGYDVNENIRLQYSQSGSFKKTILGFRHYSGGGTADAQSFKRALIQTDKMPFDWHVEKTYGTPDGKHVMYDLNSGVFYVIN